MVESPEQNSTPAVDRRDEPTSASPNGLAECPQVSLDVDTAGSIFNATVYALKNGAFNQLPLVQLHQLTGHLIRMENRIRPYVSG